MLSSAAVNGQEIAGLCTPTHIKWYAAQENLTLDVAGNDLPPFLSAIVIFKTYDRSKGYFRFRYEHCETLRLIGKRSYENPAL